MGDEVDTNEVILPPFDENYEDHMLDLHDISLLLNYERAATEPRFRHAKLREVATTSDFQTIRVLDPEWAKTTVPRTGLVFDRARPPPNSKDSDGVDEPTCLRIYSPAGTYKYKESHVKAARDVLLAKQEPRRHLIDLFPQFIRIRVRTVEKDKPRIYSTLALERLIVEFNLIEQNSLTVATVFPDNMTYISGADPTIIHAVLGFATPGGDIDTILDLASLQFGDVGRGFKGRGLFVLEPIAQYLSRLDKFAKRNTFKQAKLSQRINDAPDTLVRALWGSSAWSRPQEVYKMQKAYYCDAEHQLAAWPFHKHFCEAADTPVKEAKEQAEAEKA
ncbi:hypothetical protein CPB84DRAFT_1744561 [Gymnopilus junonius]|uniref:MYND-type domain-containing protein n=1 Tax=Gymnopilus junonius TaxID=109634 RepID=A0A9P5NVA3_GYMJU|nr:hypothetical protein CPB84DRAFT_1744561 [Gymnopilus junonius]